MDPNVPLRLTLIEWGYSFDACLSHMAIVQASLARRSREKYSNYYSSYPIIKSIASLTRTSFDVRCRR